MSKELDNQTPVTPPAKTTPAVFTVSPHRSFLQSVASGILTQVGNDPLQLADYSILVPNRDVAFQLKQAFMEQLEGRPGIMPRIEAPGDIDDDYLSLQLSDNQMLSEALMDIPPPVDRFERQLILAAEILKIPGMASSLQKAVKLGGELGRFLDEVQRNNVELSDIDSLVPKHFEEQWAKTSEFLKIITETWPQKLREMGKVDPEAYKNVLIQIESAHWKQNPPKTPIIAVGFTETTPTTLDLLQTVAAMPQGAVVLPGVDLQLDQQSWDVLTPVHPQYGFKKILSEVGIARAEVTEWQAPVAEARHTRVKNLDVTNNARQTLLREAMRPAGTAEGWSNLRAAKKTPRAQKNLPANDDGIEIDAQALSGMDLITCGSPQEEASVIALKLRETLEVPGRTATLVTADRSLARRVSARLRYWGIHVEDEAGKSLADSGAGIYLLATAQMTAAGWAPVPFLEALQHPLATLGESKADFRQKLGRIEDLVLHGPRPAPGAEGMREALTDTFNRMARRPKPPSAQEMAADKAALTDVVDKLEAAGKDFFDKVSSGKAWPLEELLDDHIRFAEALASNDEAPGDDRIWRGDDGVKAARFLTQLRDAAKNIPPVTGADYADLLQGLMREVNVRSSMAPHPGLRILSPTQALLDKADVTIAAGLTDEVWPARAEENPWLSPDMIQALGLPAPEQNIGRAAHQFVQTVSAPDVLLTRSLRSGDAPAVASPFLTRLMMVLKGAGLEGEIESRSQLADINLAMQTPTTVTPIAPPAPTPPVSARPKELPVTAVEALMRDPYTVYAKYVLNIRPRRSLDSSPSVAERGTFTHEALDTFVKKYPDTLPDDAYEQLLKIGRESFKTRMSNPTVQAFWWPRFERVAKWFVKFEAERREMTKTIGSEVRGKLEIDLGGDVFTLTSIADRIDRDVDDQVSVIDYKTGSVPLQKDVSMGFSPQLTLEALIAYTGGFDNIDAHDVGELQYWKLSGGKPAAEVIDVKGDVGELVSDAKDGITELIRTFNKAKTPYLCEPRPDHAPRYRSYSHLARTGEWGTVKRIEGQKKIRAARKKMKKKTSRRKGGPRS